MSREILVPIDGSDPSWDALEFALEHHPDAHITAQYVISTMAIPDDTVLGTPAGHEEEFFEAQEEHAEAVLDEAAALADEYDRDIETVHERAIPRTAIVDYAEEHDVDQIVMGSHGRGGIERLVIGSVAESVTRHAPVPVTIVRPEAETD